MLSARFIEESNNSIQNKHRKRWHRPRIELTKRRLLLLLPLILVVSVLGAQQLYDYYGPGACHNPIGHPGGAAANKVAVLDTLAYEYPDKGFVSSIGSSARAAGQGFDYFTPGTLSLDTFVHLPLDGYSILILRTHIGYANSTTTTLRVAITTSEPYDNYRWVADQENGQLSDVSVNGSYYFGLTPLFITERMCGRFPGTLVLAMGCYGMDSPDIARSFVQKGAGAFVGWKGLVRVADTDSAFERLVPLLLKGTTVSDAVQTVVESSGPLPGSPTLSYLTG